MDRLEAFKIASLIKKAIKQSNTSFTISEIELVNGMVQGFNQFIDNRDTVGAFKIFNNDNRTFYLFLVPWYLDDRYTLVIHTDEFKEALIGATEVANNVLYWRYKPMKRDGRNEERKKKFVEEYLNIKAEIVLPKDVKDVDNFLNELLKVANARIIAESTISNV